MMILRLIMMMIIMMIIIIVIIISSSIITICIIKQSAHASVAHSFTSDNKTRLHTRTLVKTGSSRK